MFTIWARKKINGLDHKPLALLNIDHIFTPLLRSLAYLKDAGFMTEKEFQMLKVYDDPVILMEGLCKEK